MIHQLKLAVLGGTGKSGKYVVRELTARNFALKMLVRNPEQLQFTHSSVEVVKGDARDYASVHTLLSGCDAVVSTLGQPKGERTIFSEATDNVLRAMMEHRINRYVVTTGLNVDTPSDKKSQQTKFATEWMRTHYPKTTQDKQLEYECLEQSGINWTLIRLPMIALTDERRKMVVSLEDCVGAEISATDLAHFIADQLTDTLYWRSAPFIANLSE